MEIVDYKRKKLISNATIRYNFSLLIFVLYMLQCFSTLNFFSSAPLNYFNGLYLLILISTSLYYSMNKYSIKVIIVFLSFMFIYFISVYNLFLFNSNKSRFLSISTILLLYFLAFNGNSYLSKFKSILINLSPLLVILWLVVDYLTKTTSINYSYGSLNILGLRISETLVLFNLFLAIKWSELAKYSKLILIILQVLTFFLIIKTRSRGSLIPAVFSSAILFIYIVNFKFKINKRRKHFITFVLLMALFFISYLIIANISQSKNLAGTFRRLDFIKYTLIETFEETSTTFFGRGPGVTGNKFNKFLYSLSVAKGYFTANSHNGFVDLISQFGLVGAVFIVIIFIRVIFISLRYKISRLEAFFLMTSLLYGISESAFFGHFSYLSTILRICIVADIYWKFNQIKHKKIRNEMV